MRENELLVHSQEPSPVRRLERQHNWFLFCVLIAILVDSGARRLGFISEKTMLVVVMFIGFGAPVVGVGYSLRRLKLLAIEKSQKQTLALTDIDTTEPPAKC